MKRYRLRKWVKVVLVLVILALFTLGIEKMINNYSNYLKECDLEKGYTCNIFGK